MDDSKQHSASELEESVKKVMQNLMHDVSSTKENGKTLDSLDQNIRSYLSELNKAKMDVTSLKLAQQVSHTGSWELDLREDELRWTDEIYRIFEKDPESFQASYDSFLELVHPEDREMVDRAFRKSLEEQSTYHITHRLRLPDGRIKYVEEHCRHFYDEQGAPVRSIGTIQDVTEREIGRQQLEESLHEKQVLLSEIHHRVKNNLSVVSSLLQLQCFEEEDPKVEAKLQESLYRVKTIARIHEQLYQTDQFSHVDLSKNLERLISDIIETLQTNTKIELDLHCEQVKLDMRQILPTSLIANEVITNVVKYAFPDQDSGKIAVHLSEENRRVKLKIKDDGIGLPDDFGTHKKGSLGLSLIETLTQQLQGDFSYRSHQKGTTFILRFDKTFEQS